VIVHQFSVSTPWWVLRAFRPGIAPEGNTARAVPERAPKIDSHAHVVRIVALAHVLAGPPDRRRNGICSAEPGVAAAYLTRRLLAHKRLITRTRALPTARPTSTKGPAEEVQAGLVRAVVRPEIETVLLYEDEMVLVTNPEHPFAAIGEARLEDVGREPLILLDKTTSYHGLVQGLFRQAGVVPWAVMELDSLEAAKKMAEEGLGIAMLPSVAVEREIELGTLTQIKLQDAESPRRSIALIYRRNRRPSRTMLAFLGLLHETYAFEWPAGIGQPSDSVLTTGVE